MSNLWVRCNNCRRILYQQDIIDNLHVCPVCNFHFRLDPMNRIRLLLDEGKYTLFDQNIFPADPLEFEDTQKYSLRLETNKKKTSLPEAVINAEGKMGGIEVIISVMSFAFMGGSMGSVVGEKITRAAERSLREEVPFIVVSAS